MGFVRHRSGWLLLFCLLLLAGCQGAAPAPDEERLVIFAAASLTDAFEALARDYEAAHPGSRVTLNFAASSQLATQLQEGARADLFASAAEPPVAGLVEAGLIAPEAVRRFAANHLVVILPADNPAGLDSLEALARPGLRLVVAAPETPIGGYTLEALARMDESGQFGADFGAAVQRNVVSQEPTVRLVVTKVVLGEADAAIVYRSDVTPDVADALATLPIPQPFNVQAHYPLAPLREAPNPSGAAAFVDFVLSAEGQATMARWGFAPP